MYLQPQQKNSCGSFEIWMNNKLELKTSPPLERFLCYHNCVDHFQLVHIVAYIALPFSQPHPCSPISPITSSLSCFFSTMHLLSISNIKNKYFSSFQQHNRLFVNSKLQAMEKPNIYSKVHLRFWCIFGIFETLILLALHMSLTFLYLKESINVYSKNAWKNSSVTPKKGLCSALSPRMCAHDSYFMQKLDACEIVCISSIQKCYKHIKNTMTWSMTHVMNIVG
jgi:hypothetical protein